MPAAAPFVALLAASILAGPPPSPASRVVDRMHGAEIADDYRWLESLESESVTVREWTTAQNDYTRGVLDGLPGRQRFEERLDALMTLPSMDAPAMHAERYFNSARVSGRENQPVLFVRAGLEGAPQALLDPNALDAEGLVSLDWWEPSQDGGLLAFGLSRSGDENSVLHVLDVASGRWLADEISGKVGDVQWRPDGRSFFYHDLADVGNPYSGRIRFHELGTHPRQDRTLFQQYKEGPYAATWGPFATVSRDARWMILGYWTSTKANDLWVIDLDRWHRSGEFVTSEIIVGDDSNSSGPVHGDTLFMETTFEAPKGRIVAVELNDPRRERWREIVPEKRDAVLRSVQLARGRIVARYERNASTMFEQFTLDGRPLGTIELPGIGTAALSTDPDRTEAFLTFTSFNDPTSIWRLDLADGRRELWERLKVPFDPASIEVRQVWYPSADGIKVSMFIVHRKGLKLDGKNPTLLYGYGGFNISLTPTFRADRIPWLLGGGVYAVPNLRGGGEYGEGWHEAGMLGQKQNVFDDFIAAAEYLVKQRYTSPEHLAILGGSNGGLLVGAAITQRPDLFAGAVCAVPLLDMLRYQDFLMAKYWVPEYGDPADAEAFRWLRAYSPYQNIKPGVRYPATLFTAGEHDSRVHPMHARKMVAQLQAVARNDFDDDPIMLWVEREAGHGAGKPLSMRIRDATDVLSFLAWQTGMSPE